MNRIEIFNYINNLVQLSESEKELLLQHVTRKHFEKNQIILRAGEVARCFVFVEKGMFRSFYVDSKGNEKTDAFFFEGNLVTDFQSYMGQIPSNKNIEALEDSIVYSLSHESRLILEEASPNFVKITEILSKKVLTHTLKRYESLFLQTPEERYISLMRRHPEIFQKIQLKHIAEFINVRPQSLSRIRKRIKFF